MAKVPLTRTHPSLAKEWSAKNSVGPETVSKGTVQKYQWECLDYVDHTYWASPNSRTRLPKGTGCPYCSSTKLKKGFNDFKSKNPELAEEWSNENTTGPDEVMSMSNKPYKWTCKLEGHTYTAKLGNRVSLGRGCPSCSGRYAIAGETDLPTTNPVVAGMWSKNNKTPVHTVKEYTNKKFLWVCDTYGYEHEFKSYVSTVVSNGGKCLFCTNEKLLIGFNDMATVREDMAKDWSDENSRDACEFFSQSSQVGIWECSKGHKTKETINNRYHTGCSVCSGKTVVTGVNDLNTIRPDISSQWSPTNLKKSTQVSVGSGYKAVWVCTKDSSHTWRASVNDRTRLDGKATGCPECIIGRQTSVYETELQDFLDSIGVTYKKNDRHVLKGKELDILIEDKKIAIEFNGVFHHSEYHVDKYYHRDKWSNSKDAGYQLITIWSSDWRYKRTLIEGMLKYKLGLSDSGRTYARNTKVVSLTYKEASQFMETHHIQGPARGTIYKGLISKDGVLLACMILKRYGDTLRLERYATSESVVGGQSKLIHWVDTHVDYKVMETFADLSLSDGGLYEKTGWTRDSDIDVDYRYLVSGRLEHKFNYRKSNFKAREDLKYEEGLTESELAALNKLYRVYDCGKIKYVRYPNK